jgi:hypothetical protein
MIEIKQEAQPTLIPINVEIGKISKDTQVQGVPMIGREPTLYYNGIMLHLDGIHSFELNSDGFMPILHVFFNDKTDEMANNAFARDNTIISLYLSSRTKDTSSVPKLRDIRIDFKIVDYSYLEDERLFYVQGVMNVDKMYTTDIAHYESMSSLEVVRKMSSDMKLGFSTNTPGTNDRMTWINPDLRNFLFIQDTVNKAYRDETSFFTSFVDFYYNVNFINVETQFQGDITNVEGVLTHSQSNTAESDAQTVGSLVLTNSGINTGYNNTFVSYEVSNKSTKGSIRNGYRTEVYYYDKFGNAEQRAGTFLRFKVEPNTEKDGIALKSFEADTSKDGFYNTHAKKVYMSPVEHDNIHTNYNYATVLNKCNNDELYKLNLTLYLTFPNYNYYKYQKVEVIIYEMNASRSEENVINRKLSGEWVVTAINFTFNKDEGLVQVMKLARRKLNE